MQVKRPAADGVDVCLEAFRHDGVDLDGGHHGEGQDHLITLFLMKKTRLGEKSP